MTVLLYSGECPFCRFSARQLAKLDPALTLIPLRHPDSEEWLGDMPFEEAIRHWWVITPEGDRFAGNQGGGVALLKAMPWSHWVGVALEWLHLGRAMNTLDNVVNQCRPFLAQCVPDGPAPIRVPPPYKVMEHPFKYQMDLKERK